MYKVNKTKKTHRIKYHYTYTQAYIMHEQEKDRFSIPENKNIKKVSKHIVT